jgi:hypothetical protein
MPQRMRLAGHGGDLLRLTKPDIGDGATSAVGIDGGSRPIPASSGGGGWSWP